VEIRLPYGGCSDSVIDGDYVYTTIGENSNGLANKIISYNIKTAKVSTVYESKQDPPSVAEIRLNKDWMIWMDSTEYDDKVDVYSRNRKTGEVKIIYSYTNNEGKGALVYPVLFSNYAAWIQVDNNIPEVILYNLSDNSKKSIARLTAARGSGVRLCVFPNSSSGSIVAAIAGRGASLYCVG
jgi:6-phosphogluconolactonase (cycloisomerase 2 family)